MSLTGSSPVFLVSDLEGAAAFWRDRVGFEVALYGDPPDFATATRDSVTLLFAACADPGPPHWQRVDKMWNAYIRTDDAEGLYAELQGRGCPIDYTIYDAPHGFREFGIQDPDGHDIAFGQPLR